VKKAGELPTAFWDSSALVPLCIQESTSRQVRSHLRKFAPVVWWASPVEVHSAVARLHRSGAVNDLEKQGALSRLALLRRGWREILPDDSLRELASRLLDVYTLRASDSLQLAAALTWCQQRPAQRRFISGDQRLCDAAEAAGFVVIALVRPGP
jgi:predicted nucleic acid-binding protein